MARRPNSSRIKPGTRPGFLMEGIPAPLDRRGNGRRRGRATDCAQELPPWSLRGYLASTPSSLRFRQCLPPPSVIRTVATSIFEPATTRSAVAVASPAWASATIPSIVKPCARIMPSVISRGDATSSSRGTAAENRPAAETETPPKECVLTRPEPRVRLASKKHA
jgi:hypothetical protein